MVPAQSTTFIDYDKRSYELKNVKVTGNEFSDEKTIIAISGLHIGQKISIPGQEIPQRLNQSMHKNCSAMFRLTLKRFLPQR